MNDPVPIETMLAAARQAFTVDEAVTAIHRIHAELESVERYRLKLKWWMGCVLVRTMCPPNGRTAVIDEIGRRLWAQHQIRARKSTLYQCAKLYEGLAGDYRRFEQWIDGRRMTSSRPVYWYDVVNDLLGGKSNPAVVGKELADEMDYLEAERAIEAIERIVDRAANGNETAAGVLEGIRQSVVGLMLLPAARRETPRSSAYRQFVSMHACMACGRRAEAHHAMGRRGSGIKPSDFGCVPLCREHHADLHIQGRTTFEAFYAVRLSEVVLNLLHRYLTGAWLTMELEVLDRQATGG